MRPGRFWFASFSPSPVFFFKPFLFTSYSIRLTQRFGARRRSKRCDERGERARMKLPFHEHLFITFEFSARVPKQTLRILQSVPIQISLAPLAVSSSAPSSPVARLFCLFPLIFLRGPRPLIKTSIHSLRTGITRTQLSCYASSRTGGRSHANICWLYFYTSLPVCLALHARIQNQPRVVCPQNGNPRPPALQPCSTLINGVDVVTKFYILWTDDSTRCKYCLYFFLLWKQRFSPPAGVFKKTHLKLNISRWK